MVIIYKLISSNGFAYIGSTTQKLEIRLSGHKYASKKNKGPYKLFENGANVKAIEIEKCSLKDRFIREKYWLDKTCNALNLCTPWQGPKDFKLYDYQITLLSKKMKERWLNNRDKVLTHVNSHKTKEFQKAASAAGHKAKYKRMPLKKVTCISTNKVLGQFKTQNELAKILGIKSRKTIYKMINGKGIYSGKYNIEVIA